MSIDLFPEDRTRLSRTLRQTPIADTVDGTNWAIKALHPADGDAVPRGLPSLDALPIVNLQWQQEHKIAFSEYRVQDVSTWDCDVLLLRHPVLFAAVRITPVLNDPLEENVNPIYEYVLNRTLKYDTYANKFTAGSYDLSTRCEQYRVSYAGCTAHLQANATSNQGAVTAGQFDWCGAPVSTYVSDAEVLNGDIMHGVWTMPQTYKLMDAIPEWETLVAMPHAYTNDAKYGAYMPLKLASTDEDWVRTNYAAYIQGRWDGMATNLYDFYPAKMKDDVPQAQLGHMWTYPSNVFCQTAGTMRPSMGAPPGRTVGLIKFRGLDPEATINLVMRVGIDMKVAPDTDYAPFMHNPPVYDPTAMRMYYEIARRMADAYPASYNATGDLLKVVMDIASQLMPLVEPHAREILAKLTSKINSAAQRAVAKMAPRKRGGGGGGKKGAAAAPAPAAEPK